MELVGYLAGAVCIVCLGALGALGDRRIRIAVAAFAVIALAGYGLFVVWLTLYGE